MLQDAEPEIGPQTRPLVIDSRLREPALVQSQQALAVLLALRYRHGANDDVGHVVESGAVGKGLPIQNLDPEAAALLPHQVPCPEVAVCQGLRSLRQGEGDRVSVAVNEITYVLGIAPQEPASPGGPLPAKHAHGLLLDQAEPGLLVGASHHPLGRALLPKRGMEVGSRDHGSPGEVEIHPLLLVDHLVRGTQVAHEDAARGAVITQTQVLVPALSRQLSCKAMVEQVLVVKCTDLARAGERERERERER
mmetsp:Transcript_2336/g.7194  ORF Transcript_2336/g.7194 Transcript_2336/m.7194 type:complete len:250 (+) Transcript_2336:174-923(+)